MTASEQGEVVFGTSTINYRIERSNRRKTVTVAVDPAEGVILKAPADVSVARLDEVVTSKGPWILQRMMENRELGPTPPAREYVSGESCLYLGRHHRLKVRTVCGTGTPRASLVGAFLIVEVGGDLPRENRPRAVRNALTKWYRRQAGRRIPERVAIFAARTAIGCPRVLIRSQQKRWGSCSSKGELRFNPWIVMAPMSLLDYVVAHEVCHLQVPDHSVAFWKLLRTILPDYEERRARLRVEGLWYRL